MVIRVIYRDGEVGTVKPADLEALIQNRRIYSFKRSSGWVDVSRGPLRQQRSSCIAFPERRADTTDQELSEMVKSQTSR
jgi:hypothetical protein